MSVSAARVEANRRNAEQSTGPKTPEGKEASRRNALKHGLTGGGIVVPNEDLARIARVAEDLRNEYAPTTTIGLAMAEHVATLIVRLDRCGRHELALIDDQVAAARYDFDQARRDWADELFGGLETNPARLDELMTFPEGIDRLVEAWSSLAAVDEWSADELARVEILSEAEIADPASLRDFLPDLIARLEAAKAVIDRRPIDRARQHAADLALFSTSPEANHARKYEAATSKALDKSLKILEDAKTAESAPEPSQIPEATAPVETLASFLPNSSPRPMIATPSPTSHPQVTPEPPVDRARRPDPRKLRAAMDRKRR